MSRQSKPTFVLENRMHNLELFLPSWTIAVSNGSFTQPDTCLMTKYGRVTGNAIVTNKAKYIDFLGKTAYEVLTDIGTGCFLTEEEMKEYFHEPQFICNLEEGIKKRRRVNDES